MDGWMDGWMDGYGMDDFRRLPTRKRRNIPMYSKDFLLLSALKSQK